MDNINGKILSMLIQAMMKDEEIELINILKNCNFDFEEIYSDNLDDCIFYILRTQIKYEEYMKTKKYFFLGKQNN